MKRPSFQFYPHDWRNNANLRRCSWAARGAWLEVMSLMHDSDDYGVLRWSLKEIAQALGCPVALLRELAGKGVLKGADTGTVAAHIYTPRSGRRNGDPVTLIESQPGPIWFSSRMVKDEHVRKNAGASTRFGADPDERSAPKPEATERASLRRRVFEKTGGACHHCLGALGKHWEIDHLMPKCLGGRDTFDNLVPSCVPCNQAKGSTPPEQFMAPRHSPSRRDGERPGDGSPSPSPPTDIRSSLRSERPPGAAPPDGADPPPDARTVLWSEGLGRLRRITGKPDRAARTLLGQLCRVARDDCALVSGLLHEAEAARVGDPIPWLQAAIRARTGEGALFDQGGRHERSGPAERRVFGEGGSDAVRLGVLGAFPELAGGMEAD